MRNKPNVRIEQNRTDGPKNENCGIATFRRGGVTLLTIFSDAEGWDHVSVSLDVKRCPTWDEMCWIKDQFFTEEEMVIQYHPRKSEYVKTHPFVLHLWRPQSESIPQPPIAFV